MTRAAWPETLVAISFDRPGLTIAVWLGILSLAAFGLARLEIDTSTSSFLDRDGPAWSAYQHSLDRHGGDELLVVALWGESPWDREVLANVVRLSREFGKLAGVRRVDSLATVPLIREFEDSLMLDAGLSDGLPQTEAEWQRFVAWVRADRVAKNSLVSADETMFAINLLLDRDIDADRAETVDGVRALLTGVPARITGVPVFRTEVNSRTRSELTLFVPVTVVLLALVIGLFIPSVSAVMVPLVVGGVSTVVSLGTMGALGVSLSLSTTILPSMLLGLGCAYAMHIVTARDGKGRRESIREVASPVALSGATTAIGFVGMASVPISAIRELATYGAVGVLAATLASLTLAPAILRSIPIADAGSAADRWMRRAMRDVFVRLISERSKPLLLGWGAVLLCAGVGLARLEIATDIILWFPEGSEIRDDYEVVKRELSGITPVNVLVEATNEAAPGVQSPTVLGAIDRLASALDVRPDVGKSLSVADPLRLVRRAFEAEAEAEADARLPADSAVIEQYLLVLAGVDRLDDVIHSDRRGANIVLRVDENASDDIVALGDWVRDWWQAEGVPTHRVTTTGIMYEFGRAEEAIAHGQVRGLLIAACVIGLVLWVVMKQLRIALISLGVNLVPIAIGFGALGLLGVALDAATVCLGSMALGIAVDDTIHLVTRYREMSVDRSPQEALRAALQRVLPPLVMTTLAIAIGFAVLGLSGFTLIRNLGIVTAALVTLCLLADLTLLPALLVRYGRRVLRKGSAEVILK